MKTLLIVIVALVIAVTAGWITFSKSRDKTTITIDSQEFKDDTREAIDQGKRVIEESASESDAPPTPERPVR